MNIFKNSIPLLNLVFCEEGPNAFLNYTRGVLALISPSFFCEKFFLCETVPDNPGFGLFKAVLLAPLGRLPSQATWNCKLLHPAFVTADYQCWDPRICSLTAGARFALLGLYHGSVLGAPKTFLPNYMVSRLGFLSCS